MRELRARVAERFPEQRHDLTFLRRRALAEHFAPAGAAAESLTDQAMEVFLEERNRVDSTTTCVRRSQRLRAKHRLFALSNGNADLRRCGIADLFDGHVTASAAGAAKPDVRIFAHLLRVAGVRPSEVLHVGDDPWRTSWARCRRACSAVWLNREARAWPCEFARPPRTISTLAEIV